MKPRASEMRRLCEQVARDVGDGAAVLADQKEMFVSLVTDEDFSTKSRAVPLAAAAAALLVVGFTAALLWPTGDRFAFWIGENRTEGEVGAWLEAPSEGVTVVAFEQGSRLTLLSAATARVVEAGESAVAVDLSRGSLEADIVGNNKTKWTVDAGPFRVTVLGTVFTVLWDAREKVLDVKVKKGVVLVQGRGLSEHGLKVTRGRHLRADSRTGFVSLNAVDSKSYDPSRPSLLAEQTPVGEASRPRPPNRPTGPDSAASEIQGEAAQAPLPEPGTTTRPVSAPPLPVSTEVEAEPAPSAVAAEATTVERRKAPAPVFNRIEPIVAMKTDTTVGGGGGLPSDETGATAPDEASSRSEWLALYADDEFGRAVRAAKKAGIETLCRELASSDLWKLQDAARIAKEADVAVAVLTAYRGRFSGTGKARLAAFLLGKVASDEQRRYRAASEWFNTYLREDQEGPLAEEALGRLIVVYGKMGRSADARRAAKQYLRKYGNGSFEGVAKAVAESD
jgi:ferric-dicitrate binding protein FerR (iron transport regulator)/TolA-binding protein